VTTAVVYVFPNLLHKTYDGMARRFAHQYVQFPPGETNHELYVVVNGGGQITKRQEDLFAPLVPKFIYHDNSGRDVGAFQMAARQLDCDLMVCIGAPARPRMAGWLDIMCRAVEDHGSGLYGLWAFHAPATHVRTTCFWLPPQLMNWYPVHIHDGLRYDFEHGSQSITRFAMSKGMPVLQVTRRGVFSTDKWHHVEYEDCLFLDQHSERLGWTDEGWP
jgi:hypothetical protein